MTRQSVMEEAAAEAEAKALAAYVSQRGCSAEEAQHRLDMLRMLARPTWPNMPAPRGKLGRGLYLEAHALLVRFHEHMEQRVKQAGGVVVPSGRTVPVDMTQWEHDLIGIFGESRLLLPPRYETDAACRDRLCRLAANPARGWWEPGKPQPRDLAHLALVGGVSTAAGDTAAELIGNEARAMRHAWRRWLSSVEKRSAPKKKGKNTARK